MELKNQTILITGADGFIGSHLTEMLIREGAKVKALSQYNSFNYWGWLEEIENLNEIEILTGDVRDPHYCKHITKNVEIAQFEGLSVEYAHKCKARVLIRGLRAISDFEAELSMASINKELDNELNTVFLMTAKQYAFLSSSAVKELARMYRRH